MIIQIVLNFILLIIFAVNLPAQAEGDDLAKKRAYLDEILSFIEPERPERGRVTRLDSTWRDWLSRTGELPPDFDSMPSLPFLPDPLVLDEGGKNILITYIEQWREKREWIKNQVEHWITGTFPPVPDNLEAIVLSEKKSGEVTSRLVELRFGPGREARLTLELLIPPGEGPFPVFLTQWNHRSWALIAVRRGYIGCMYAGADARDDTEGFADIWYPQYDFTRLMRRAWGAHRAVDYLYTLPFVDKEKIGITGHSRNGKQSIMAAAFDERITAVIPSSGGTGAEDPFRYTSDKFDNESISDITTWFPFWLHPRLRFFIGREHKLPVDQNLFMALIAPRGLMLSTAITEPQGNPWGIEENYRSLERVYRFLKAENKLAIRMRQGLHTAAARDIEAYVDFFDYVFGRKKIEPPRNLYYNYSFDRWRELSGEKINPLACPETGLADLLKDSRGRKINSPEAWEEKKKEIRDKILWSLGDNPRGGSESGVRALSQPCSEDYLGQVISRPEARGRMGRSVIGPYNSYGGCLFGDFYYPADENGKVKGGKLPVVIFLHEYAFPTGFGRRIEGFFEKIVERGAAVFAFDMVGFGTRIEEGTLFYERYPHWSEMGRMVADVRSAVDMLQEIEFIDPGRIYAAGYSLGGTVGLYAAALDERIKGAAAVCAFTPLRLAAPEKGMEGIKAYSHLHGLIPRLGFFVGRESRLPVDFPEILASIAPRPLLASAPLLDRDACFADVKACLDEVAKVYYLYGAGKNLTFSRPRDYNRFSEERQAEIIQWLEEQLERK